MKMRQLSTRNLIILVLSYVLTCTAGSGFALLSKYDTETTGIYESAETVVFSDKAGNKHKYHSVSDRAGDDPESCTIMYNADNPHICMLKETYNGFRIIFGIIITAGISGIILAIWSSIKEGSIGPNIPEPRKPKWHAVIDHNRHGGTV